VEEVHLEKAHLEEHLEVTIQEMGEVEYFVTLSERKKRERRKRKKLL
jgi:hypothetical protein